MAHIHSHSPREAHWRIIIPGRAYSSALLFLATVSLLFACGGPSIESGDPAATSATPPTAPGGGGPPSDTTPPSTPSGLTAALNGLSGADLSWQPSTDNVAVTSYIVRRGGTQVATPATNSYSEMGLAPATTYSYTVAARDAAGNVSPFSGAQSVTTPPLAADQTPPTQPGNLQGSAPTAFVASLSWDPSTDNVAVAGYRILRNSILVASTALTFFTDSGLTPLTTYAYSVQAFDAAGNLSPQSPTVSVTTPALTADPIDNLAPGNWLAINSHLDSVGPNPVPAGASGVPAVMDAWSGGAYDTKRDRLIVWGGGHSDYAGNEVYVFSINTRTWTRATNPSTDVGGDESSGYYPDGLPRSRHTYGYVEYIPPPVDRFCVFGGSGLYPSGQIGVNNVDCLNLDTFAWERKVNTPTTGIGSLSGYDPVTGHTWIHGVASSGFLAEFDYQNNRFIAHGTSGIENMFIEYSHTGVVEPVKRKFVGIGGGDVFVWNLGSGSSIAHTSLSTTGGAPVVGASNPGLAYDPILRKVVAWNGGTDLYALDIDGGIWTRIAPAAGNTVVPTAPNSRGTYGRFRYIPSRDVYIVVNRVDESVFIYRRP